MVISYSSIGHSAYELPNSMNLKFAVRFPWPYSYGVLMKGSTKFVDWMLHIVVSSILGVVVVWPPLAVVVM